MKRSVLQGAPTKGNGAFLTLLLSLLLCFGGPILSNPQPEAGAGVDGNATTLLTPNFSLRLEPLQQGAFFDWLKAKGINARLLENERMSKHLARFIVFRISLENRGEDTMSFNPEQMILRNKQGLVGFQASLGDFLRSPYGYSDPDLEKLAALFVNESYSLTPGQRLTHVVAYKPLEKKFPRKVRMLIDRLYYGTVPARFAAWYKVKYP